MKERQQPFLIMYPDGRIKTYNLPFLKLIGYSEEDIKKIKGNKGVKFWVWQEKELKELHELAKTKPVFSFMKECLSKNKTRIPIELFISVIKDNQGEVRYFYALAFPFEEQKLEVATQQMRGHFSLLGHFPSIIYRCMNDKDWTMKWIKGDIKELSGYDFEDLIDNKTTSWGKVIDPDDFERTWDVAKVGMIEKRPFQQEYRIITKDGKKKWVLEQNVGLVNSKGEEFFEGFITDITERKIAEKHIESVMNDCKESVREIYNINTHVLISLQEVVSGEIKDLDIVQQIMQQNIQKMLDVQTKLCSTLKQVAIDFAGFNQLAQDIEFIFDGKNYFYPKE